MQIILVTVKEFNRFEDKTSSTITVLETKNKTNERS